MTIESVREKATFDKSFWKSFGWFLLIAAIICCMPWALTREWFVDFSETGEIGDTIGGIMGPFMCDRGQVHVTFFAISSAVW